MSYSLKQLEIESDCKIHSEHECKDNELPGYLRICNISMNLNPNENQWELFSVWLANDYDVKSGEAERIGEVMNISSIKINYCPFCGIELHGIA